MTWFKTYQKYVFFVVIVGWGTATNLNKQKTQKLFQLWYCFLSWQIFDFPGPAEADDQRGGRLDLTRDGQAGGVLHQKENIKLVVCKGEVFEERKARSGIKLWISRDFNYDQLS